MKTINITFVVVNLVGWAAWLGDRNYSVNKKPEAVLSRKRNEWPSSVVLFDNT